VQWLFENDQTNCSSSDADIKGSSKQMSTSFPHQRHLLRLLILTSSWSYTLIGVTTGLDNIFTPNELAAYGNCMADQRDLIRYAT